MPCYYDHGQHFKRIETYMTKTEPDRRRSERLPKVLDAWICSPTSIDPLREREEVRAVNLSRHGVAFISHHPIATGSYHNMHISMGAQEMVSEVHIMNCRKTDDNDYEIGAEFC